MGVFLAYVGQHSYVVDCFATSTDWEYELFKTDDAMAVHADQDPEFRFVDSAALDQLWPDAPDISLDGWLTSTRKGER